MISDNLESVHTRIADAARKSGRPPESVRLIAVSKEIADDKIIEARKAGAVLFGENKVQEALDKIKRLAGENIRWHFIGHLQKNKVKQVVGRFEMIHSIDSLELAEAVHKKSVDLGVVTPVLFQVNISGEESKFGISPGELEGFLRPVSRLPGIRVEGLMTIPPFDPDPGKSRPYFVRLRELRDRCAGLAIENISMDELSMGMSNDFEVAVEEGATIVRVGTAIFGPRRATPGGK
ncbi:MAG: YggS family pyridoxal phosphate-dependent enzyme [Nitrospinaceae bacterium]